MTPLSLQDVYYSYGNKPVLNGVSFAVQEGHCTMLLGPNGAGKTTVFSLIIGLLGMQRGSITLPVGGLANIGIVFQQPALDSDLTVAQNLSYHGGLHGMSRREIATRVNALASRFKLDQRLSDKVRTFNGGHKRRIEIMRALMTKPRMLLLDEPTTGFDIPTRNALVDELHTVVKDEKIAVLWSTHLVDEVWPDDHLVILNNGKVTATTDFESLLKDTRTQNLSKAYAVLTGEAA